MVKVIPFHGLQASCSQAIRRLISTKPSHVRSMNTHVGGVSGPTETRCVAAAQYNRIRDAQSVAELPFTRWHLGGDKPHKSPDVLGALALALAIALPGNPAAIAAEGPAATSGAALELQQAYDKYSSNYDELDGGAAAEALGFPQLRQKLLAQARGDVLEVAVGTGLNLPYYRWAPSRPPQPTAPTTAPEGDEKGIQPAGAASSTGAGNLREGVTSLATVDLSPGMLFQARRRVEANLELSDRSISFSQADVASLPFTDSSFDSVVDTFSLCVFPDPQVALNEIARVVRPASAGGRVLLLEHSRSDIPLLAAYQDATAGPVAALGKGCLWNQDVEGLAARAGLRVQRAERSVAGTVELLVAVKE